MSSFELLYKIFEDHLFDPSEEEATLDAFVDKVVQAYLAKLQSQGVIVPTRMKSVLEADLKEEVTEMVRKKTYGSFSLTDYREKNQSQPKKGRLGS